MNRAGGEASRIITAWRAIRFGLQVPLRALVVFFIPAKSAFYVLFYVLFERSEFLIATCKKKKTDRVCVWMYG